MTRYSNYYEVYPKDGLDNYGFYVDAVLLLISGAWLGTAGIVSFALFKTFTNSNKTLLDKVNNGKKKEVVIVRGVPGVGKDKYVYYNELGEKNNFTVCSNDKFFYENGRYHFDRTKINQSEAYCFQQFHQSLKLNVPRVYVTNVNQQKWMYANYVKLAESYQYKLSVMTILCEDEDQLRYFNSRSRHNVPMSFSKKVLEDWELDLNETVIEPYIGNEEGYLEGDSLPYPKRSEEELNKELEDYHSRNCLIDSEQEGQITRDTEDSVSNDDEEEDDEEEDDDNKNKEEEDSMADELENTNIVTIITPEDKTVINKRKIILETNSENNKLTVSRTDESETDLMLLSGLKGYLI
jgi:hypothetical protein